MNFKDVIIRCIRNVNNKSDLKSHFIREFKKAERDNFYTVDAFFNPLFQMLNSLKQELHSTLEKRIAKLKGWIEKAGKNEYNFTDEYYGRCLDKEGIAYADFKKQSNELYLKDWQKELAEIRIDKMRTSADSLSMNDIQIIEKGLQEALNEIGSEENKNHGNNAGGISTEEDEKEPELFPKIILLALWLRDGKIKDEDKLERKRAGYLEVVAQIRGQSSGHRNDFNEFKQFATNTLRDGQSKTFEKYLHDIQQPKYEKQLKMHNLL